MSNTDSVNSAQDAHGEGTDAAGTTDTAAATPQAITVQIMREVDTQAAQKVAHWVNVGQHVMEDFPGYLGSGFMQSAHSPEIWRMIYRFDTEENLALWESSAQRKAWASSFQQHIRSETSHKRTGVEGWFEATSSSEGSVNAQGFVPPRWKQMVVIFCGFYPMTMLMNILLAWLLPASTPLPVRVTAGVLLTMPIMVYAVLPFMTRLFAPWLNKRT